MTHDEVKMFEHMFDEEWLLSRHDCKYKARDIFKNNSFSLGVPCYQITLKARHDGIYKFHEIARGLRRIKKKFHMTIRMDDDPRILIQ